MGQQGAVMHSQLLWAAPRQAVCPQGAGVGGQSLDSSSSGAQSTEGLGLLYLGQELALGVVSRQNPVGPK